MIEADFRSKAYLGKVILEAGGRIPGESGGVDGGEEQLDDLGSIPVEFFESSSELVRSSLPIQLQRKKPYRL